MQSLGRQNKAKRLNMPTTNANTVNDTEPAGNTSHHDSADSPEDRKENPLLKSTKGFFKRVVTTEADDPNCSLIRRRILIIMTIHFLGLVLLVVGLSVPDIVQVTSEDVFQTQQRLGFFQVCSFSPFRPQIELDCSYRSLERLAAPLAMFLIGVMAGCWGVMLGIRFLGCTPSKKMTSKHAKKVYNRIRNLCSVSGIFSLSGTSLVTYLYGSFVVPLRPIFVLLWFAAIILTAGGLIGHCFNLIASLMTSARRVLPLESGEKSSPENKETKPDANGRDSPTTSGEANV